MKTLINVGDLRWTWCFIFAVVVFAWPAVHRAKPVDAQELPSRGDEETPDASAWDQVRERIIPLPFFYDEKRQSKVNLERLLAQLLDESVFPNNPLQIDQEQRSELLRVWRKRQASIEAKGFDLKALALEASKIVSLVDWERLAPGLDVYGEQRQTAIELSKVLNPSQTTIWRDMAIAQVFFDLHEFHSIVQLAVQRNPEVREAINQSSLNWTELLMSAALEDVRLKYDSYIQLGRLFDRITAVLPASERDKLDRYLKVDLLK